jgi:hypothetical protein
MMTLKNIIEITISGRDLRDVGPRVASDSGSSWVRIILFLSVALFPLGCAETQQARETRTAGFLEDYSILRKGAEGEALLVYHNSQADFSTYQTVYVDSVVVLINDPSEVSQEDLKRLADDLRSKVIWQLKQQYLVVPKSVPDALRVELALTEAAPSNVGMDVVSTLLPPVGMFSGAKGLATGTQAFVGSASVEAKITDSSTGELLLAAVDRRVGGRTLDGSMDSWDDVQQAFTYWAEQLNKKLGELRTKASSP